MAGKRVARSSRSGRRFLVVLAVAALLTVIVGWSAATILERFVGDDASPPAASPSGEGDPSEEQTPDDGSPAGTASEDPAAAQVGRCADEIERASSVVTAARHGVQSWETHLQARTDMLAKRISERRMAAIYASTREQGRHDVRRFEAVVAEGTGALPCHELPAAGDNRSAADCLSRSEAAAEAVASSEAVMGDWSGHLHHMDQYEDGGMSTGKALELWIKAWRSAPENIRAFEEASSSLDGAPACTPSGA